MSEEKTFRILVVDDEPDFAKGIARLISSGLERCPVAVAFNGRDALEQIDLFCPDVMLLDLHMPDMHGLTVLEEALQRSPNLTVVVLTAHANVESAVSALKNGAWDFLAKPVRREDLLRSLAKCCERSLLLGENERLTRLMSQSELSRTLIGDAPAMRRLKESIRVVAASGYTVLIQGESGTGKELVAESIHALSDRRKKPLIGVNCPAIPEQLLESELFGHTRGAFTGAVSAHRGLFAESSGGTLVLDEIGDIPPSVQIKLLRALQEGEVRPLGGSQTLKVDTRIIAVTNQDLEEKIRSGLFREDLFYRLNVLTLRTPPLRERREDIPLLAQHFLNQSCREMDVSLKSFSPSALAELCRGDWPGNVRQLQNMVRRLTVFCSGPVVRQRHLHFGENSPGSAEERPAASYKEAKQRLLDAFTLQYVTDLLKTSGGNISEAARISGLERVSLQKILRRHGIDASAYRRLT